VWLKMYMVRWTKFLDWPRDDTTAASMNLYCYMYLVHSLLSHFLLAKAVTHASDEGSSYYAHKCVVHSYKMAEFKEWTVRIRLWFKLGKMLQKL
jgi:hypothetical protein